MNFNEFFWLREPKSFKLDNGMLEVVTNPNTDLWQRTYYQFCNDNAPMFLIEIFRIAKLGLTNAVS